MMLSLETVLICNVVLMFFSPFVQTSSGDIDLSKTSRENVSELEVAGDGDLSSGMVYLKDFPCDTLSVNLTLKTAAEHIFIIDIQVLKLGTKCDNSLVLKSNSMAVQICKSILFPQHETDTIIFPDNSLTMMLSRKDFSDRPEIRLRYTIVSNGTCGSDYFTCDNKYCIWRKLTCDGNNNCGDYSDEMNSTGIACATERYTGTSSSVIIVSVLFPLAFFVLCILVACFARFPINLRTRDPY